jgi:hypothetical protein
MENFIKQNRVFSLIYSVWFFVNFAVLFISDGLTYGHFYPFDPTAQRAFRNEKFGSLFHSYDMSEFIFYTLSPLILFFIYKKIYKISNT